MKWISWEIKKKIIIIIIYIYNKKKKKKKNNDDNNVNDNNDHVSILIYRLRSQLLQPFLNEKHEVQKVK